MQHYRVVVAVEVAYLFGDMLTEEDKENLIALLLTQLESR